MFSKHPTSQLSFAIKMFVVVLLMSYTSSGFAQSLYIGQSTTLSVSAPKGSVDAASWSSDHPNDMTLSGNNPCTVTLYRYFSGTATIKCFFSFSYWDKDLKRMVVQTATKYFNIGARATTITVPKSEITLAPGETYKITYTTSPSLPGNYEVYFRSDNTNVADVSIWDNTITARNPGECIVKNDDGLGTTARIKVIVKSPEPTGVSIPSSHSIYKGDSYMFNPVLTPSGAKTNYTWSSSDTDVATINSNGVVTGKNAGSTHITLKTSNGLSASCDLSVKERIATAIKVSQSSMEMKIGDTKTLSYTTTPTNCINSVTWSSSNEKVATVSSSGSVKANSYGSATIMATTDNGYSASCLVSVLPDPTSISLPKEVAVDKGESIKLTATLVPSNSYKSLSWSSSNTYILEVSSDGTVTGKEAGNAIVKVKTHNGLSATCPITVKKSEAGSIGNINWKISSDSVLTISGKGKIPAFYVEKAPWYEYKSRIKKIVIESGITSIGNSAFDDCTNVCSVSISETVDTISAFSFNNTKLTELYIPASVKFIDSYAFRSIACLSTIEVDKRNSVYDSRENCNAIIHTSSNALVVGSNKTTIPSNVKGISVYAFYGRSGLTLIKIPSSVEYIDRGAFYNCTSLKSIICENVIPPSCGGDNFYYVAVLYVPKGAEDAYRNTENWKDLPCITYIGDEMEELRWELANDGTLNISGKGLMDNYTPDNRAPWFNQRENIKRVVLGAGVLTIGDYAFEQCSNLTSIDFSSNLTRIGGNAFNGCKNLEALHIPALVTKIATNAFVGCESLKSIEVDRENSMYDSRDNCNAIIETKNNILLHGCTTTIIPNTVTIINSWAFDSRKYLQTITIPTSVTTIVISAFADAGLTSINIPSSVTYIGGNPFVGCPLKSISVDKDNNYYHSDNNCNAIISKEEEVLVVGCKNTVIPSSVKYIGSSAFNGCVELKQITLPSSLKEIRYRAFAGCNNLSSINIPNSVTSIGSSAFEDCSSLESIDVPNSVNSIEEYAFSGCTGLTKVLLGTSLENIGNYAFYSCKNLRTVNFPSSLKSIGNYVFWGCNLSDVMIPASLTKIGNSAFANNLDMQSITVASGNPTYDSRNNCNAIIETATNKMLYGGNKTIIPSGVVAVGASVSWTCSGIHNLFIPASVKEIGVNAFARCANLESIMVEDGNTVYDSRNNCNALMESATNTLLLGCATTTIPENIIKIGKNAFAKNESLHEIEIPESVTELEDYSFYDCINMTKIVLPKGLQKIGSYALSCKGLTEIYSNCTTLPELSSNVFKTVDKTQCTLYVPKGCRNLYQSAAQWKEFVQIKEHSNTMTGDVNDDGKVNATDLVALVNIILVKTSEKPSADVNGDGKINGTDYVNLVNLVLNEQQSAKARGASVNKGKASLCIDNLNIEAEEEKDAYIYLNNPCDAITLVQFDLYLPDGLTICESFNDYDIDIAGRTNWQMHSLAINKIDDHWRVLLSSDKNDVIEGEEGAVIRIKMKADATFVNDEIQLKDVLLVSPNMIESKVALVTKSQTTSLESVGDSNNNEVFTLTGLRLSKPQKGINIIKGKKVLVK